MQCRSGFTRACWRTCKARSDRQASGRGLGGLAAELADCKLALGEAAPLNNGNTAASAAAVALYAAGSFITSCDATPKTYSCL